MDRPPEKDHAESKMRSPNGQAHKVKANKVERIASESVALFDDIKSWVDLRIQYAKFEIFDEVERITQEGIDHVNEKIIKPRQTDILLGSIMAVCGVLAMVFVFITLAIGLGWWLGQPFWGFLIVTGLLLVVAMVLKGVLSSRSKRRRGKHGESGDEVREEPQLSLKENTPEKLLPKVEDRVSQE